jgi:DNA-binding SARP family transcriptional activator
MSIDAMQFSHARPRTVSTKRQEWRDEPPSCSQYLTFSLGQNGQATEMFYENPLDRIAPHMAAEFPVKIYTLGQFSVVSGKNSVPLDRKGQHKPIEMLKALIALGGKDVGEMRLCEALWPDTDGDTAHSAFSVTLHRLRKLIGRDSLLVSDSRLTLNHQQCWVDVWACEQILNKIQHAMATAPIDDQLAINLADAAMYLYNGPFLGNEDEQAWYLMFRERLHSKMIRSLMSICHHLDRRGRCQQAMDIYQKGIELEPLAEEFYYQLMLCYAKHERKAEALATYLRCAKILNSALHLEPSKRTQALYHSLLN